MQNRSSTFALKEFHLDVACAVFAYSLRSTITTNSVYAYMCVACTLCIPQLPHKVNKQQQKLLGHTDG